MRVLVAGAGGVVGRPLLEKLREAGHEIVALASSERSAAAPG
jgi:nucleoside-diphosphate-sugar epimerase